MKVDDGNGTSCRECYVVTGPLCMETFCIYNPAANSSGTKSDRDIKGTGLFQSRMNPTVLSASPPMSATLSCVCCNNISVLFYHLC